MKNQTKGKIIISRQRALTRICLCGLNPKHQTLYNEALDKYKEAICASEMTYQLVQPDDHRRNIAEKSIKFCKEHFITILRGAAITFPLHLWCQVIPQAEKNCYYYDNQMSTKTCTSMPTYTATMTILTSLL